MVSEALQWAVIAMLCLVVLGILRHLSLTMPPRPRANTISGPSVGQRLPRELVRRITSRLEPEGMPTALSVAFIVESCAGCQRLLAEASQARRSNGQGHDLVLVVRGPTPNFSRALDESGVPALIDDGKLWAECGITNTPLVVRMASDGRVLAKAVTAHVDEVATSRA
jgi:hypothetical protein